MLCVFFWNIQEIQSLNNQVSFKNNLYIHCHNIRSYACLFREIISHKCWLAQEDIMMPPSKSTMSLLKMSNSSFGNVFTENDDDAYDIKKVLQLPKNATMALTNTWKDRNIKLWSECCWVLKTSNKKRIESFELWHVLQKITPHQVDRNEGKR